MSVSVTLAQKGGELFYRTQKGTLKSEFKRNVDIVILKGTLNRDQKELLNRNSKAA